jgi:hypothetical protein
VAAARRGAEQGSDAAGRADVARQAAEERAAEAQSRARAAEERGRASVQDVA